MADPSSVIPMLSLATLSRSSVRRGAHEAARLGNSVSGGGIPRRVISARDD
jgi:hypothetical protein